MLKDARPHFILTSASLSVPDSEYSPCGAGQLVTAYRGHDILGVEVFGLARVVNVHLPPFCLPSLTDGHQFRIAFAYHEW